MPQRQRWAQPLKLKEETELNFMRRFGVYVFFFFFGVLKRLRSIVATVSIRQQGYINFYTYFIFVIAVCDFFLLFRSFAYCFIMRFLSCAGSNNINNNNWHGTDWNAAVKLWIGKFRLPGLSRDRRVQKKVEFWVTTNMVLMSDMNIKSKDGIVVESPFNLW